MTGPEETRMRAILDYDKMLNANSGADFAPQTVAWKSYIRDVRSCLTEVDKLRDSVSVNSQAADSALRAENDALRQQNDKLRADADKVATEASKAPAKPEPVIA